MTTEERILIVESDPDISDLIAKQALKPLGYDVRIVRDAAAAIAEALANPPDLVVANLALPDLSGKDLLAAFPSQGVQAPVVVIAERGEEKRVIEAFRLGATDAIMWPARDAEVVRVIERALQQTRALRTRQALDQQLQAAHQELERRVRDLTAMLSISRALISIGDQQELLGRILDGALQVAQSDVAWIMLRDEASKNFVLKAHRNLPWGWAKKINQPLDDGLSSLVAISGQSLTIHGAPLEKFKVAALGKSAAVMPVKVQDEVVGLLIVVRKADLEVDKNTQTLLAAVADFASISINNARLFRVAESSAGSVRLQQGNRQKLLAWLRDSIHDEVRNAGYSLDSMASGRPGPLTEEQQQALHVVRESLNRLARAAEAEAPPKEPAPIP